MTHGLNQEHSLQDVLATPGIATSASPRSDLGQPQKAHDLPVLCPGCGALSQDLDRTEPGFYSRSRKAVKNYRRTLRQNAAIQGQRLQEDISEEAQEVEVEIADLSERQADGIPRSEITSSIPVFPEVPVCDRCHDLIHKSTGVSIAHPSIDAIADSITESPFRRNHVYHVLDAADFPMSLIPSLHRKLSLAKPRSQNRRSRHRFSRKPTLDFLITRSDLLAPSKEIVDSLMPYFTSLLREALGRAGRNMRLGNVHLVSSKRGWWTQDVKDSIWMRGGGNWMVGKVNVGKSNLFEVLFPKGSGGRTPSYAELQHEADGADLADESSAVESDELLHEDSLLPPAQPENPYPVLPIVSSLPGTTASPIRLPFDGHRGELIDLPGLARGNLDEFVHPDHKRDLVMEHRPTVAQHVIRPGQSLLLGGGLIRITPHLDVNDPGTTMLAYPFVPIPAHVTSTDKAEGIQQQQRESGVPSILDEGAGEQMRLAGTFQLRTDVTRARAKSLLNAGVGLEKLPFRVYATDILVEGVGWIELVCQVRRRSQRASGISDQDPTNPLTRPSYQATDPFEAASSSNEAYPSTDPFPTVSVFSPHGQHVASRRSMGAWALWEARRKARLRARGLRPRPRRPMKGAKKREKLARRAREAAEDARGGIE